jgi:hypothetical protein
MSAITSILDRLSGVAVLKAQVDGVSKNVDRSMNWLLDHEKRILKLENNRPSDVTPTQMARRISKKKSSQD